MGWTGIARSEHSREGLRYPSDMTEREWLLTAPFIPPAKTGDRRRTTDMREVVNALLYIASSGGAWRMLPKCFAPVSTVRRYFYAWRNIGLFETINIVLVMNLREIEGREAHPSAGVIDSQSVKEVIASNVLSITLNPNEPRTPLPSCRDAHSPKIEQPPPGRHRGGAVPQKVPREGDMAPAHGRRMRQQVVRHVLADRAEMRHRIGDIG
jgi:transposase